MIGNLNHLNLYVTHELNNKYRYPYIPLWLFVAKKKQTEKFEELCSPPGNKFDLGIGQRSRSPHGTNRNCLSQ